METAVKSEEPMAPEFTPYDIVDVKNPDIHAAVVIDYRFRWADKDCTVSEIVYTVHTQTGRVLTAAGGNLERIGRMKPPIDYYEIVKIVFSEEAPQDIGKQGIVLGCAWNPETGEWNFAVLLEDGVNYCYMEKDLERTEQVISHEATERLRSLGHTP